MTLPIVTKTPQEWVEFWERRTREYPANSGVLVFFSCADCFCASKVNERKYKGDSAFRERIGKLIKSRHTTALTLALNAMLEPDYSPPAPKPPDPDEDELE